MSETPAAASAVISRVVPRSGELALRVDGDSRPDRATHVRLGAFDGPLALLLSLIEQRQMDVLEVPLGDLAGAYLDALASLPEDQLPHLSEFISVSAQLILIKSRALLPRAPAPPAAAEDGHDPEAELRARLVEYRRYRDAAARLLQRLDAGLGLAHREAAAAAASGLAGARPPVEQPLDPAILADALSRALRLVPPPAPPPEIVPRAVTLAERAQVIRQAIRSVPTVVLQELLRDVHDRVVVAVTFMAMLELVKSRELVVEQDRPWGPIVCRSAARERSA
jgi:segregation and condensation protein A